jgi:hypothetical protein
MQLEDAKAKLAEKENEVTELLAQAHRRRQQMLLSPERASHRAPTPSNTWQAARDVLGRLCNTVQDLMENGEQPADILCLLFSLIRVATSFCSS